ncbi:MAG: alpha-(1-_3)-arabinofuranosyltransferase family protein, partial [Actinomycetota bacterium]
MHPITDPSPLMRPLRDSPLGLALRSSTRAIPLSSFGLALGAGALVAALATALAGARPRLARVAAPAVAALAVVNLPALWTGGLVDPALTRDQQVPTAWTDAAAALDAGSLEHRVLQLPGSEFGAFRWGYTVDPPLPGLTDKPLVTRDLLPLGSPGAMDLLYALDNRFQSGTVDPDGIAAVARLLGVDTIWLANDLAFDRFRTPRPELVAEMFGNTSGDMSGEAPGDLPDGLSQPTAFGAPAVNVPDIAMVDEQQLSEPLIGSPLAPVELVGVDDAVPIIRSATSVIVLAGSGDGIVDAAAAGLLAGDEAVLYAADIAAGRVPAAGVPADAPLIVTDSNRDRASQWRGSQDANGLTEVGGPLPDALRENSADQRLAVFAAADESEQTVSRLERGLIVRASSYGEPFAYRPEDRPAMSVDGNPLTAWSVAVRADPIGEVISVSTTDGRLVLLQPQDPAANRVITQVEIDDGTATTRRVDLTAASLSTPGQAVSVAAGAEVTITITDVAARVGSDTGPSGVGFAELGPVAAEITRLPSAALSTVTSTRPLAIVMTRERVRPTDRWRSDPEATLTRELTLPVQRSMRVSATLRLDRRATDAAIATLGGYTGAPTSNRHLIGVPGAGGRAAFDGDPATAFTTPFGTAVGSAITVPLAAPSGGAGAAGQTAAGPITITQPLDGLHSVITEVGISIDGNEQVVPVPAPDGSGRSTIDVGDTTGSSLTITITAVSPAITIDRRFAEPVQLPASIAEITGLAIAAPTAVDVDGCHYGLLAVDGEPLGVT